MTEAVLIKTDSQQFIISLFRNSVEQDNAHHSALEMLTWLSGTCTLLRDFFMPYFS